MLVASALIDGCLVNFAAPGAVVSIALPTPAPVHHCVFWSTFRATLRVPAAGLSLTADQAAPACGTFSCSPQTTVLHITVAADDGPLSHAEQALATHIIAAAHADAAKETLAAHTHMQTHAHTHDSKSRNNAIPAAQVAPARARLCVPALAAACPHLISSFRGEQNQRMCVVRAPTAACSAAHAKRNSSNSRSVDVNVARHGSRSETQQLLPAHRSAVASLLAAAASQAREWRKCAVSFSTVMRFFQREKATFKWAAAGARSQTVISAIAHDKASPLRGQGVFL
jgi:hypothetical protein